MGCNAGRAGAGGIAGIGCGKEPSGSGVGEVVAEAAGLTGASGSGVNCGKGGGAGRSLNSGLGDGDWANTAGMVKNKKAARVRVSLRSIGNVVVVLLISK